MRLSRRRKLGIAGALVVVVAALAAIGIVKSGQERRLPPVRFAKTFTVSPTTTTTTTTTTTVPAARKPAHHRSRYASPISARLPPASAGSNGTHRPPPPASAPGGGSVLKADAAQSFQALQASLPGSVGVALLPVGSSATPTTLGDDGAAHAWSTSKVPVLVALIQARSGALTANEQGLAQSAITQSDNSAILSLFGDLEQLKGGLSGASAYIGGLFQKSGDPNTSVATGPPPAGAVTTFGQTQWAPSAAVKFFSALGQGCLIDPAQTSYVLGLMQHIISSESWGLGSSGFTTPVAFKGGWGPEGGGYLVRQSGVIDPGTSSAVAVSVVVHPPAGSDSFGVGTQMITRVGTWLAKEIVLQAHQGSCVHG